ncbi:SLC13 family permease [Catenovulum maritimum]|uniref:Sodium:dicarboxylate symporter n=1 Tax=Catenovulum maritimum TaxID=1513271 RepID=A0A0J8GSV1_9ALTE|nr:SLC13 family permease [Catenovulum maritimum]KMT65827.1 sodium:dicarboxylate symporter [Catenovulum maritimum]
MRLETTPNYKLLILGPMLAVIAALVSAWLNQPYAIIATIGITVLTATWWVTEALPIPVTSILPIALFPLFGVLDHKTAASSLGSHVILLLMGAFMLSKAVEKSGVHKRLALNLISFFGEQNPKKILLGLMITSAVLSMWVSNTATTLMLLPIVLAIISGVDDKRFATVLLLGIAYAASVGGMGTPIGTPPNVIFSAVYQANFNQEIGFIEWMKTATPVVVISIPLMALWLGRNLSLTQKINLPVVGQWQPSEKRVLAVFGLVALAWIFRSEPFGGWSGLLNFSSIGDSSIALFGVVLMFLVPSGNHSKDMNADTNLENKSEKLLDWKTATDIPWGMLLLFAGGICVAKAFQASGLSALLGDLLSGLSSWPVIMMILLICLSVTFLTEITSNTATTTLLMPVLAVAGIAANIDPKLLMIPAAMSASCAFMLPVATAPNAIVYGSDKFSITTMVKEGVVLNFMLAVIISAVVYLTV